MGSMVSGKRTDNDMSPNRPAQPLPGTSADVRGSFASMLAEAVARHGVVLPCGGRRTLEECVTVEPGVGVILWYNTPDGGTHVVRRER